MKNISNEENGFVIPKNNIRELIKSMCSFLGEMDAETVTKGGSLSYLLHSVDSLLDAVPNAFWDDWVNDKDDYPEATREEFRSIILELKVGRAVHGVLLRQEHQDDLDAYWKLLREQMTNDEIYEVEKQVNERLMNMASQAEEYWECPQCRDSDGEDNSDVKEGEYKPFNFPDEINLN